MAEVVETLLKYNVDQGSVAAAVSANEKVALSLREAQEAAASVGLTTQEFLSRTGAVIVEQEAATAAIQGTVEATNELKTSMDAAAESQTKLASSGGGINVKQVGSRVAGLGAIVGGAGGAGFRDVSQLVMLGASFGVVGAAAGVLAIGLRAVTDSEQKAAEGASKYSEALQSVSDSTTEDINQRIKAEQQQHDVLTEGRQILTDYQSKFKDNNDAYNEGLTSVDEYQHNLKLLNAEVYDATGGVLGLKDGVGTSISNVGEFNAILGKNQEDLNASSAALAFLNIVLGLNSTAANDAAEALQAHDERLLATSQASADAEQLTSAERQKKVAGMQDEIERYQGLIQYGGLSQDTIDELNLKIQGLTDAQKEYNYVLESQADIVDRLTRQAEGISEMMDAITAEVEAEEALRDAHQKIADDERETTREIERIRADEAEKETADRNKAADARTKAIAKTADDEEKALRSHLEKLADIEDRYRIDSQTAEGDRDALGLLHANEVHDKALKDENQSYDDRLDDLQKALDDQLDAIQEGLDDQLQAERDAAQKQIANVIEKEERILEEDRRALAEREVDLVNANATIAAITQTSYSGLEIQTVNHYNNLIGITEFGASVIESRFSQMFQNITGGSGASQVVGQAVEDTLWILLRNAGIIS